MNDTDKLLLNEKIKRMCHLSTFTKGFYLWFLALYVLFLDFNLIMFLVASLVFWHIDARYLALERFFISGTKKPNLKTVIKTMVNSFSLYLYPLIVIVFGFNQYL